ncbi:DUF6728 family protein [Algoriphagus boritolerans]|uniref:Uncharacterized protein n=1 Tax=Algoriphagus boritolerans DSM 17298 = JCM 18970 TaxID=1120964 RepID=A0A1H5ZS27_9BACT|nr:DUF6728 family protein [Algoriphagus boritolerans]SEG38467.1 hypothetical protein SAMN03080598_03657 [Algoriphagus boritolerans DSM 17298 = JCM 18970]
MSEKNQVKEFFKLGEVGNYFLNVFRKPDPNKPTNFNLRMMHGINKISIIVFLFAIIVWTIKRFI